MDLKDLFKVHRKRIVECLDTDFGLLDELLANQSLTSQEFSGVKAGPDSYGRCEKLLEYVSDKGIFDKFLDALKKTNQTHLVNFILSNGQRSPCFENDWPLTGRELTILYTNQPVLVDRLDTSYLISQLFAQKIVNNRQKDFVSSKATSHEKNEAFLEILRRTSLGNYENTIQCLHLSKQSHIAKILDHAGADTKAVVDLGQMSNANYCTKHENKPFDNYCTECKGIVCLTCHAESHELHDCKEFASVEGEFRQAIKRAAWKTSSFADEMLSLKKNALMMNESFLQIIEKNEAAIKRRNQELKDMIERHTDSLLHEISTIKSNRQKDMRNQLEEIEKCCTSLRTFESYCTELTSKGSSTDICSSVDHLIAKAAELEKDHEAFIGHTHKLVEVEFKTTDAVDNLKKGSCNFVGNLEVKTNTTTYFENFTVVVGLSDGWTPTRNTAKISLRRSNETSIQGWIPTKMQREAIAAVYCNTMYVAGIGDNFDEIWKYSVGSGWMKCASLVQGRRRHSAAFVDEILYICGGVVDSDRSKSILDSVEAYDAVNDRCIAIGKLVHSVQNSGNCVPFKSSLYIFGGADIDDNVLDHVQMYNTKENNCSVLLTPMPRPLCAMRAILWETDFILLGRYTCFIFNIGTGTWKERKQFKIDANHFGFILDNERLFVIGGGKSKQGTHGQQTWNYRDDIRHISLHSFLDDKATQWKIHATLPKPSVVHAYAKMRFPI